MLDRSWDGVALSSVARVGKVKRVIRVKFKSVVHVQTTILNRTIVYSRAAKERSPAPALAPGHLYGEWYVVCCRPRGPTFTLVSPPSTLYDVHLQLGTNVHFTSVRRRLTVRARPLHLALSVIM